MLVLEPTTKEQLTRIVYQMTENVFLREDLLQEAMIHFWRTEHQHPGQQLSWYLQGCVFHLRHYLEAGRSVDSAKRRRLGEQWSEEQIAEEPGTGLIDELSVVSLVAVRDMLDLLGSHLDSRDLTVLLQLLEGHTVREIAQHLNFSHTVAVKARRKIAATAVRLGIGPPSRVS